MKVIIAGSRTINIFQPLMEAIDNFKRRTDQEITEVVSGNARGVDRLGEWWAVRNNIPIKNFPADWEKYGKSAGHIRNKAMADYADGLILVWDGDSKGSASMLNEAKRLDLLTEVHIVEHK